jgi:hypothetical protein
MSEQFSGKVDILNSASDVTISLNGNNATISAGGSGNSGIFDLLNEDNANTIRLASKSSSIYLGGSGTNGMVIIKNDIGNNIFDIEAKDGFMRIRNSNGEIMSQLNGSIGNLWFGGHGLSGKIELRTANNKGSITLDGDGWIGIGGGEADGDLLVANANGEQIFRVEAKTGNMTLGGHGKDANLDLKNAGNDNTIRLASKDGSIFLGGSGTNGMVIIKDDNEKNIIDIEAKYGFIRIRNPINGNIMSQLGSIGDLWLGGQGHRGEIELRTANNKGSITLDGDGFVGIGGGETDGILHVKNANGEPIFIVDVKNGEMNFGGHGKNVHIALKKDNNSSTIDFASHSGSISVGGNGTNGNIILNNSNGNIMIEIDASGSIDLRNSNGVNTIFIDANAGDIKLAGADFAEKFEVSVSERNDPGTVMVIDESGKLLPCKKAYDKKVAGVVSGALDTHPGIILGNSAEDKNRLPIALTGRVFCKVDADISCIEVGDLLTTSTTFGHAMKADCAKKSFGAVLGKAMLPLSNGKGLIPILVALQ